MDCSAGIPLGRRDDRWLRKFGREHVNLLDGRRLCQKLRCLCHQRRGYASGKMGLAPGIVRKGVKDAEGGRSHAEREPRGRRRLLLDDGQASTEEGFNLSFFSRLCFQADIQRFANHLSSLLQFRLDSWLVRLCLQPRLECRCVYSETVLRSPETIVVVWTIQSFARAEQAAFCRCPMLDASLPCRAECRSSRSPIADYRQAKSCS